jgi:hypothetical protein
MCNEALIFTSFSRGLLVVAKLIFVQNLFNSNKKPPARWWQYEFITQTGGKRNKQSG